MQWLATPCQCSISRLSLLLPWYSSRRWGACPKLEHLIRNRKLGIWGLRKKCRNWRAIAARTSRRIKLRRGRAWRKKIILNLWRAQLLKITRKRKKMKISRFKRQKDPRPISPSGPTTWSKSWRAKPRTIPGFSATATAIKNKPSTPPSCAVQIKNRKSLKCTKSPSSARPSANKLKREI